MANNRNPTSSPTHKPHTHTHTHNTNTHTQTKIIIAVINRYLLTPSLPAVAGVAYLSSVPPSGNKAIVGRFMRRDFLLSMRMTYAFVARSFAKSLGACREVFFSPELPEADLRRCAVYCTVLDAAACCMLLLLHAAAAVVDGALH